MHYIQPIVIRALYALYRVDTIEYEGTVWAIDHNNPEPLLNHAIHQLELHGIRRDDIIITDAPEGVRVGEIVVEIWPHHLDVTRVRTIRNESFISGTVMTIELKLDESGEYAD